MLDHALALAARGFRVFPLQRRSKKPLVDGWRDFATTDPETIERVWKGKDYNIGVLCTGMIVVDLDVKGGKQGPLSYFEMELPQDTLTVRTPSGGFHKYLAGPNCRNHVGLANGIDIRSQNGYVAGPGSVLNEGSYEVVLDVAMAEAPESFVEAIGAPRERWQGAPLVEWDTPTNVASARLWLANTAPRAFEGDAGDQTTYAVACGVRDFGISEDLCYDLLLDLWNDDCSPPWEPDELRLKVENAYTYATGRPGSASPEFEYAGVEVDAPETKPRVAGKWLWAGEAVEHEVDWLFYQRLPRTGTGILVGPSNSGKSFLAYEMGECLGSGGEFFGVEPDHKLGTLVLASEGMGGIPNRLRAMPGVPLAVLPVDRLDTPESVKSVSEDIEAGVAMLRERFGVELGLIIVETLSATRLVQDENDNNQCADAIKKLEMWSKRFGAFVLVTHHPPKSGVGTRGGGALTAGVDTVIEVQWDGNAVRYVECTKGRDAPTGKWGSFTLPPRTLGQDSRGRDITTCEVSMGFEQRPLGKSLPHHFDKFALCFDAARKTYDLGKNGAVPRDLLRKEFSELVSFSGKNASASASNAFKKCWAWALAEKLIQVSIVKGDEVASDCLPTIVAPQ